MIFTKKIGALAVFVASCFASASLFVPNAFADELKPKVVSLDSCADQIILHLADAEQILALSPNSQLPFSFYKERALGFSTHGGSAEEILSLMPDVALRTGLGDFALARMLGRMGVATIATGLPDTLDGIKGDIAIFGEALDQTERAQELIADIDARL
ncbi:MAG: ABC transporter substrate-binding protein, partial [Sphingomonadales bacterium]|nr:ABC transporter substrate-binding protein [Sphingomonadales bacterium]